MIVSKKAIENYNLLKEVYGNYNEFQEKLLPVIKNYTKNSKTVEILEIGSGTGITTQLILDSRKDISLTSIDIDKNTIDYLKKNYSKFHNDDFNLINDDALNYLKKGKDNSYDIIVSAFTIHNFRLCYRKLFYKELYRVMKNDSVFLNADKYSSDDKLIRIEALKYRIGKYIDVFMKKDETELLKEWITHYIDDQSSDKVMLISESKKIMKEIGFKRIEIEKEDDIEMMAILTARK